MLRALVRSPALPAAALSVALLASARARRAHAAGGAPSSVGAPHAPATAAAPTKAASARTLQLVVRMTCESCARAVRGALEHRRGVQSVDVDLATQTVLVTGSDFTTAEICQALEEAGRSARVVGLGGAAGVVPAHAGSADESGAVVVEYKGPAFEHGSAFGVVRAVQTTPTHAVVEWEIGGLEPLADHRVTLHQYGDTRFGAKGVGAVVSDLGAARADAAGVARFGPRPLEVRTWEAVGRGVVLWRGASHVVAAAVAARSAGVDANTKKRVCTCDGTTIWEPDPLTVRANDAVAGSGGAS